MTRLFRRATDGDYMRRRTSHRGALGDAYPRAQSFPRVLAAVCLLVLVVGCGSARRGAPVQSPVQLTEADDVRGEQVFMRFCNGCHPGGEAGLGPALNNKILPGFLIKFQVRRGLGVMPSFSDGVIGDEELDDLVGYLIALRHHD